MNKSARISTTTPRLGAVALASLAIAAATLSASAQAQDKRLSVSAFGQISKFEDSEATGNVFLSLGYLFTPSIEGELRLSQTLGGPGEYTLLGAGGRYYFGTLVQAKSWLPYAHASFNTTFGSGIDFKTLRGGVGIDVPLSPATSLMVEGAIVRQDLDNPNRGTSNGAEVLVGFKVRF